MVGSFFTKIVHCSNCNEEIEVPRALCWSSMGSSDLDGRPSFPARMDLLMYRLTACPKCGYCNTDIEVPVGDLSEYIKGNEYISCKSNDFCSSNATKSFRHALICLKRKEYSSAFYSFLEAAWACDDYNDFEKSVVCRKEAINIYFSHKEDAEWKKDVPLIVVDMLRRIGQFKEAVSFASSNKYVDSLQQRVANMQIKLSLLRDNKCYSIEDEEKD